MSLQLAAASYVYINGGLKTKRNGNAGKGSCTQAGKFTAVQVCCQTNLQSASGLYNNFTRMSPPR